MGCHHGGILFERRGSGDMAVDGVDRYCHHHDVGEGTVLGGQGRIVRGDVGV